MRLLPALLLGLLVAGPAWAGDLVVSLKTPSGKPVAEAVVMVAAAPGALKAPIRFPWAYRMAQKTMSFAPFVLVVPVGAEVAFPNFDPVLHHVYSFSPAKPFELKLYGRDETRLVRFDRVGIVAVGCNIHDDMTGYVRVVDTPFAAKTNAAGEAVISGLPAGPISFSVWHPYLKAPRNEATHTAAISAGGASRQSLTVNLRARPMKHGGY